MLAILAAMLLQDVDNPQYQVWASCKAGSWVKVKRETTKAGSGDAVTFTETESTMKVAEVSSDKIVVEVTGVMRAGEGKKDLPPYTNEILAKVLKAEPLDEPKVIRKDAGDEELDLGGKKLKCKWVEVEIEKAGTRSVTRTWTSDEIPGGVARMESRSDGVQSSSLKMTVLGWEKK